MKKWGKILVFWVSPKKIGWTWVFKTFNDRAHIGLRIFGITIIKILP